ncbi:MAG TPA: AAA family ATPase [Thermomicrobiales bacterium]|nr:AAA family ATPase [Thermomicrobiales bacterium]
MTALSRPDEPAPPLVGRDRERAALRDCLAAALAGRGRLVLLGGEAGIGKTALAAAFGREAAAGGALVLAGHCYDLTETPPYGPWVEALAGLPADPEHPASLAGDEAGSEDQGALFARVRDRLAAAARRRPLALLLEDLHWADPGSLDLLRYLARGAADLPLLLVATYREDEVTRRHPLFPLLPLLVREAGALRLDLRRLAPVDARALAAARYRLAGADEDRLVAYLADHAAGNPLYIGELLRTLEEEGLLRPRAGAWALGDLALARVPPLLRQVIEARLLRLGEGAHELLSVAAVIGQEVPLALWAAVGGVAEDALLDVVEAAVEARLLVTPADGADVAFAHALIREALYEGLLPPRRRVWHRRVAEALLAPPGDGAAPPDPDAAAYHLQRAGDPRAAEWLIRAGERAQRAYALLTAAERFDAALQLLEARGAPAGERAGLLYRLARMWRYADPRMALASLDDAAALAAEAGDGALSAYIACFRGGLRCAAGEIRRGLAELEAGVAAIDALAPAERERLRAEQVRLGDPPDEYHYRGALVTWLALTGRCARALEVGEGVVARPPAARAPGTSGYANTWGGIASAHTVLGQPDEAARAYAEAGAAYRAVEHHYQVGNVLLLELYEVALPYRADDPVGRRRLAEEAEAAWARASGALADLPPRFAWLPLLLVEGQWAEARGLAEAAAAPGGRANWRPFAKSLLALLAREVGEPDLAWRLVREHLPAGHATAPGDAILLDSLPLLRLAAALALDAGDLAAVRSWLEAHDRWLAWSDAVLGRAQGHLGWAAYHRAVGEVAPARRHAERALALAGDPRQPLALLAAHRALGELDAAARRHDDAAGQFAAALALADACAAPYERALTLLALAESRAAAGDRAAADATRDESRALLAPLGAKPARARADALAATLASVPAARAAYPAGLTAREVEVLRLVAEGLTDAQVAERLFLSPRTVSQHLRSVYNKLGVSSRAAATRFGVELGLW